MENDMTASLYADRRSLTYCPGRDRTRRPAAGLARVEGTGITSPVSPSGDSSLICIRTSGASDDTVESEKSDGETAWPC